MRSLLILGALLYLFLALPLSRGLASNDSFYPEAQSTLDEGKAWTKVLFDQEGTGTRVIFRVYYPFAAQDVWKVLTDTNSWKSVHPEFADSGTLDQQQFEKVKSSLPNVLQDYYKLVGPMARPSHADRIERGVWTSHIFQRFSFPFPLKDRWCVLEVRNDETKAGQGKYRYTYKMITGNFKTLEGYWELLLVPEKAGWTEFRGEYKSDPGIEVPHFLTRSIVKSSIQRDTRDNIKTLSTTSSPAGGKK